MRGILILGLMVVCAYAQPGSLDSNFNVALPTNFQLQAISQQDDGRLLIGGSDGNALMLFRLRQDGSRDRMFKPLIFPRQDGDHLSSVRQLNNGRILVTGGFQFRLKSLRRTNAVFLTPNGRLDRYRIPPSIAGAVRRDGAVIFARRQPYSRSGSTLMMLQRNTYTTFFTTRLYENISTFRTQPDDSAFGSTYDSVDHSCAWFWVRGNEAIYFSLPWGRGHYVSSIAGSNSGPYFVAGTFGIVKMNGFITDTNFHFRIVPSRVWSNPYEIVQQIDGRIIYTENLHNTPEPYFHVGRLNDDGSVDETFETRNYAGFYPFLFRENTGSILLSARIGHDIEHWTPILIRIRP